MQTVQTFHFLAFFDRDAKAPAASTKEEDGNDVLLFISLNSSHRLNSFLAADLETEDLYDAG